MTVDTALVRPGDRGLHQAMARLLQQLKSSAVNGAVPAEIFERVTEPMRLTPEARKRVIATLAELGLRIAAHEVTETAAPSARLEHTLALVRRHIPSGPVTREQLARFGRLAGLGAAEIAALAECAQGSGIPVEEQEAVPAQPESAATFEVKPEPAPEVSNSTLGLPAAVAAARRLISDDRFRADPGKRLLSPVEEVGLSVLVRGGVDRAGVEPTEEELSALPADDIRRVARDTFVLHNVRLVYSIIQGYLGQGLEEEDLVQHGALGLMRAVRKFDPLQGYKFSTYATWWIRQSVTRAIADEGAAIRIPVHMHERMHKVAAAEAELRRIGKPATAVDVALATGLDIRAVEEVRALSKVTDSLDRIIGDGVHLGDFLFLPDRAPGPEEVLEEMFAAQVVDGWLAPLSEKEADILRRRLGLNDEEPQTLEQIGQDYGVTRERIRQLEARALAQIREQLPEGLRRRLPEHLRKSGKKAKAQKGT